MHRFFFSCLGIMSLMAAVAHAAEVVYTFTTVDIPLHVMFQGRPRDDIVRLADINNQGEMIGTDFAADGFLVSASRTVTEIRCPDDRSDNENTTPAAINNVGAIVGYCTEGVSPGQRSVAFQRDQGGTFTGRSFPTADGTIGNGLNDQGDLVGQYWGFLFGQGLGRFHGFVWQGGAYTTLDASFDGAFATTLLGINNAGQIIGTFLHRRPGSTDLNEYDSERAFLYEAGTFTLLDMPGSAAWTTVPMDIAADGSILGTASDPQGTPQFFFYHAGIYTRILGVPANLVVPVGAWGLNDQRAIVGTWMLRFPCERCSALGGPGFTYEIHAFLATPLPPTPPVAAVVEVHGDFNGDGWKDRAGVDEQTRIWRCLAGETACVELPGRAVGLVAGDLNGDGLDDLGAVAGDSSLWVMLDGQHWQRLNGNLRQLVAGDFTGSGHRQLAGVGFDTSIWLAPSLGQWQRLAGALKTVVAGRFTGTQRDSLAGLGVDTSIWVNPEMQGWRRLPGNLITLSIVDNKLNGMSADGHMWMAPTLGEWVMTQ